MKQVIANKVQELNKSYAAQRGTKRPLNALVKQSVAAALSALDQKGQNVGRVNVQAVLTSPFSAVRAQRILASKGLKSQRDYVIVNTAGSSRRVKSAVVLLSYGRKKAFPLRRLNAELDPTDPLVETIEDQDVTDAFEEMPADSYANNEDPDQHGNVDTGLADIATAASRRRNLKTAFVLATKILPGCKNKNVLKSQAKAFAALSAAELRATLKRIKAEEEEIAEDIIEDELDDLADNYIEADEDLSVDDEAVGDVLDDLGEEDDFEAGRNLFADDEADEEEDDDVEEVESDMDLDLGEDVDDPEVSELFIDDAPVARRSRAKRQATAKRTPRLSRAKRSVRASKNISVGGNMANLWDFTPRS